MSGRCLLYGRNGVLEADALLDPSLLSRALSFNAAATTSAADDSAGRFNGLRAGGSFGAEYSLCNEHDGDGDAAEGSTEQEDRLICRLSLSMLCKVCKAGCEGGGGEGKCRGEALRPWGRRED